ncbi:MAG: hypothetical protein HY923_11000 [Elusimicrobia bacterium]|nr:hypothetical protein [Elusimicrobiota bacterium]
MKALAAVLLFAVALRAERDGAGGAAATISTAAGDVIYAAVPVTAPGINGQFIVRRLAPDGGVFWEQRWGRGRGDEATAIAATPDGGAVVAGAYRGGCFAVRFDAQGRSVWEASPTATGLCHPSGVVIDGEGGAYILAAVAGRSDFDAMVWKLAPRGEVVWSYRYATNEPVYPRNLYLDPRGDRLRAFVLRKSGTEFIEEFFRLDLAGRRL